MFISKKKFNEAIAKAKEETAGEIWKDQRMDNLHRELHDRMNHLEKRISNLETKGKKKRRCDNGITPSCGW